MLLPCYCHAVATASPCYCHVLAVQQQRQQPQQTTAAMLARTRALLEHEPARAQPWRGAMGRFRPPAGLFRLDQILGPQLKRCTPLCCPNHDVTTGTLSLVSWHLKYELRHHPTQPRCVGLELHPFVAPEASLFITTDLSL